ncbi:uncharacterized protein [Littorina saxatilis]|uniref:Uncharacterized protein n=1 Tax=Littorina saxatilis TaxID=31220 RepID=A0AAN9GP34_9CAEN
MVGWRETSSVQLDDTHFARFCAFKTEPFAHGHTAEVHKGKLFLAIEERQVIVKIYQDDLNVCKECEAELKKQEVAQRVLNAFHDDLKSVKLVLKFSTKVRGCSVVHKLLSKDHLERGTPVLIQERISHRIYNFEELGSTMIPSHPLRLLAERSLDFSHGSYIIIGAKGFMTSNGGEETYHLTSLVVHSKNKSYGHADEGTGEIQRIREFMKDYVVATTLDDFKIPPSYRLKPSAPVIDEDPNNNAAQCEKIHGDCLRGDGNGNNVEGSVGDSGRDAFRGCPPPYERVLNNNVVSSCEQPPPYTP